MSHTQQHDIDDRTLDALLRRSRPAATVPPDFHQRAWQRIERNNAHAGALAFGVWLDQLAEVLLRPRIALAALATLMVLSGTAGTLSGNVTVRQAALERYVAAVVPPHDA
ncbi:MAG: hypothetical protein O3B24_02450 [Verrucomicrobia bacterium]|nr:hypothetical protein [Verrucomicrobiota bacterium]